MNYRLFIGILLYFYSVLAINATSIEKRYRSFPTSKGMLHFIGKIKLPNVSNLSNFEYDVTYLSSEDSATINFSFVASTAVSVEKCSIVSGNNEIQIQDPRLLYRDLLKKKYKIRITTRISYADYKKLFNTSNPIVFSIILDNEQRCTATYSSSQWKKELVDIQRVLSLINK